MLDYIKAGWKWLLSAIGLAFVTLLISYALQLILKRAILPWFWRLVRGFAHLLIIHWISLVFAFFFVLIWILDRSANLWVIHWVGLLFVFFAVLIWILDRKVYRLKRKDLTILNGKVSHLESYVVKSFEDDFKADPNRNWDYRGKWDLIPGGGLSVTQSEKGGITRVGHLWADYSFEFTAVIVTLCIAWIVRAQDLSNYYMIQLNPTEVRPHLRFRGKWTSLPQKKYGQAIDSKDHGLSIKLKEPIKVRTEVRGWEIRVYIKDQEIYHHDDFFSMRFINKEFELVPFQPGVEAVPPLITGRVGFRMDAQEHGRISRCRVRAL